MVHNKNHIHNKDDTNKDNKDSKDETKAEDKPDIDGGDLQVIEESYVAPTDANGETVSEAYPGEADGWSPIVSPDELGN